MPSQDIPSSNVESITLAESSIPKAQEHSQVTLPTHPTMVTTGTGSTTIEDLPNELLANILGNFDAPAPSASHATLHDEPTLNITNSSTIDLKNSSTISKRWREATIPLLFKYPRYILKYSEDDQMPILNDLIGPFLQFVRKHELAKFITSFTLVVRETKISNCLDGRKRTGEFDSFWRLLFRLIDPTTVTIAAPAEALGSLTSSQVYTGDSLLFDPECHYLRLQRTATIPATLAAIEEPKTEDKAPNNAPHGFPEYLSEVGQIHNTTGSASSSTEVSRLQSDFDQAAGVLEELRYAESAAIFEIRPWTSLLLNEGSFIRAFATHGWWERQPPSILRNLLGDSEVTALISPSIRTMGYVGIFPMASHFSTSVARSLPRLDKLYVQIVPRNDILNDEKQMKNVEPEDLWMERNNCYADLMREMFNHPPEGNYRYLKEFESGDAADKDAWEMAVEFVKRASPQWTVLSDGVFVKNLQYENEGGPELPEILSVQ